ncbi:MAG: hypothetical protein FP814_05740 [Desulfobacterium sp.]|nr:hypothetical protein [Desulfobacterium sp.]MBU3948686.1 hypothetical protein [Pseudomonadota bacterium]MBU4037125.1 hypothetical protein [Pseudomonadota bacterium]
MKLVDGNGGTIMQIKTMKRQDERLVVRGMAMGGMPMTAFVKPEELWGAFHLLSWDIVKYMPVMLWKGFQRSRSLKKKK